LVLVVAARKKLFIVTASGAYRVIFKKDESRLVILAVREGHPREVYY
jgi:mRNA-degrading endonuclease RelE of RelBE toxin-antitoxin system